MRPGADVSVVVPLHDEEDNLDPLVDRLAAALDPEGLAYEIVLVDDGSRDATAARVASACRAHPRVRGVYLARNYGQSTALQAGFDSVTGRLVVTLDGDLQNDPADIPTLVAALNGYDAAIGYRRHREDSALRRLSSRIANGVRNRLSGEDVIDTGCSLKAFRASRLRGVKLFTGMHRFLPTLIKLEGGTVIQIPVAHRPRKAGESKYGVWNRVFRSFTDLLAVRWMKKRRLDYEVVRHDP